MAGFRGNLAIGLLAASVACAPGVDLDEVPMGADVQLVREDGGLVEGRLLDRTEERVTIAEDAATRDVPRDEVADIRVVSPDEPAPEPPPSATYREVRVPAGTSLQVNLASPLDTGTTEVGAPASGTLAEDVRIDDLLVLPAGSEVTGRVAAVESAGKVKGRASLTVAFTSISAHGESYPIDASFGIVAPATRADDVKKIGLPAAGGAVLGAIIGGKKGAAVGAAIGGGAGTAAVLMTPGDEVRLAEGTTLGVELDEPIDVKVPIRSPLP